MENKEIVKELKCLNKIIKDLFIFLLCREDYTQGRIRAVLGKVNNTRITQIGSGIKSIRPNKDGKK
jgi:hypothetical protein